MRTELERAREKVRVAEQGLEGREPEGQGGVESEKVGDGKCGLVSNKKENLVAVERGATKNGRVQVTCIPGTEVCRFPARPLLGTAAGFRGAEKCARVPLPPPCGRLPQHSFDRILNSWPLSKEFQSSVESPSPPPDARPPVAQPQQRIRMTSEGGRRYCVDLQSGKPCAYHHHEVPDAERDLFVKRERKLITDMIKKQKVKIAEAPVGRKPWFHSLYRTRLLVRALTLHGPSHCASKVVELPAKLVFSGKREELQRWLKDVEDFFELNEVRELKKMKMAKGRLPAYLKEWYGKYEEEHGVFSNWESLKTELTERLKVTMERSVARVKLQALRCTEALGVEKYNEAFS
uniref:Retrotransposon gag domain-containing protein n=1 Tax=Chromera velia CCMP2878 TaxID=1169474 RepID=A0A0G4HM98_9ALVE|eukprot:Cvel_7506.t1-p1 / transcript=Cvel_7506.t1 / gene=Cvel_7506 / organism=Chromera_velia_CCMP2878 / gene_product=hypothetical protein / transcript_product=hypothetical protein / location=Cvel_scaffold394:34257-47722(+) / protein_length=347 / sequence_SO=supercontig / SO=protein_coding / is_pseudo=false